MAYPSSVRAIVNFADPTDLLPYSKAPETYIGAKPETDRGADHSLIVKPGRGHMDFVLDDPVVWDFLERVLR